VPIALRQCGPWPMGQRFRCSRDGQSREFYGTLVCQVAVQIVLPIAAIDAPP
jgi:hypothetical protein